MRDTERETEREAGIPREPNVGLNPGPRNHTLSQRQMLNPWATQASLEDGFINQLSKNICWTLGAQRWIYCGPFGQGAPSPMQLVETIVHCTGSY